MLDKDAHIHTLNKELKEYRRAYKKANAKIKDMKDNEMKKLENDALERGTEVKVLKDMLKSTKTMVKVKNSMIF